jgi:hypothetical protein
MGHNKQGQDAAATAKSGLSPGAVGAVASITDHETKASHAEDAEGTEKSRETQDPRWFLNLKSWHLDLGAEFAAKITRHGSIITGSSSRITDHGFARSAALP